MFLSDTDVSLSVSLPLSLKSIKKPTFSVRIKKISCLFHFMWVITPYTVSHMVQALGYLKKVWILMQIKAQWERLVKHLSQGPSSVSPQTASVGEDVEKGNPRALFLGGTQTGAATVENSMEFPQNLKWTCFTTQCSHFWGCIWRTLKH